MSGDSNDNCPAQPATNVYVKVSARDIPPSAKSNAVNTAKIRESISALLWLVGS